MDPVAEIDAVIIGVGNPDRGDDGVGLVVAAIAGPLMGARVRTATNPFDIVDAWSFTDTAVVIDATRGASDPGAITVFDIGRLDPFPQVFAASSTYGLGLTDAVALGRALDQMPRRLVVVGVEGESFRGSGLSSVVAAVVDDAVGKVLEVMCDA